MKRGSSSIISVVSMLAVILIFVLAMVIVFQMVFSDNDDVNVNNGTEMNLIVDNLGTDKTEQVITVNIPNENEEESTD